MLNSNPTKGEISYEDKSRDYFENIRYEILPLLPKHVNSIFEIGCGSGQTLSYLKSTGRCDWVGGMEIFPAAAQAARGKLDFVLEGNIEKVSLPFEESYFDIVLCLDVLEHLLDPSSVIKQLHTLLKPGGILICSIPNVRHFSVSIPLLFLGQWNYSDHGILDKTHLRFFTRKSAIDLVASSGLIVNKISSTGLKKLSKAGFINLITVGIFKRLFEFQYLIRAVKASHD
jgi:SAM-dependent methyltransferase